MFSGRKGWDRSLGFWV